MSEFTTVPSFQDYAGRYFNKKNPATGKIWTEVQIRADIEHTSPILDQWFTLVARVNADIFDSEGRLATTDELVSEYNKVYAGKVLILTPFGLVYKEGGEEPTPGGKLGDLSLEAAEVWFTTIITKSLGR
jgi:hypothetical protein